MSEQLIEVKSESTAIDKSLANNEAGIQPIQEIMEQFLATADVSAVYAEPIQHGQNLIIPAAEVLSGMGFGLGYGYGANENIAERKEDMGGGVGGGGGGRTFSRPVAVVVAGPDGVRVEPVIDVTKIALGFLTALGFMVGMAARMKKLKY